MVDHASSSPRKMASHVSPHHFRKSGKATTQVAFRLLPVGLAFGLSFLSILWLTAFRPAPNSNDQSDQNMAERKTEAEFASPNDGSTLISRVFTSEVHYWADKIQDWAIEYSLDPNLIAVVMQIESCGHPEITSSAGAQGLFQVMPFHFAEGENGLDPSTNAKRGLSYLSRALELSGGNQTLALAGYNGGHLVINWDRSSWPAETLRYVYWGVGILQDIQAGFSESPRLMEWLSNGGGWLCEQAAEVLDL